MYIFILLKYRHERTRRINLKGETVLPRKTPKIKNVLSIEDEAIMPCLCYCLRAHIGFWRKIMRF